MMTTGNTPGAGLPPEAAGAEGDTFDYLYEPGSDASPDPSAPEDPRRREARLRRRRRLLKIGGVPAVLATIISLWLGSIFLTSLAGNRAAAAGHYDTALSRYRTVARINPWLEQWRVYFNLGTGQLAADDPTAAVTSLNQALTKAPKAKADPQTKVKDARSPECMVRVNLYVAHLSLAAKAQESGDSASAGEHAEEAKKAADTCEVPPPPEQNPSQSPNPSATPSSASQPSATPSSDSSSTPSSDPSSSASSSPGETPSSSPTPADDRAQRLRDRNNSSSGPTTKPKDGGGGGKPW